ncbi:MAG: alanine--tRNA ligase [bacterium]
MDSKRLRNKYLEFFEKKGHSVIDSASLVPENDPTVLFTTAGMQPLVPYLMGESHSSGKRLTSAQKCIRTDDIDEVGDKVHHTFFEMLGNWSLGDYFKEDSIRWSFEFLTGKEYLNIPLERLAFSVFAGDKDADFDDISYNLWLSLGVKAERIARLPKKNNWWGPAGQTGPCGPDTEMFIWTGSEKAPTNYQETESDPRWVEIWNNVFMQFYKDDSGKYGLLDQKNVDTGMGLERTLAVMNNTDDNYQTDLFHPIIAEIEALTDMSYGDKKDEEYIANDQHCWVDVRIKFRIIADHLRAAVFAVNDGVMPSNKERGYIVRRLIRRAIVKGQQLGIEQDFVAQIAEKVFGIYSGVYDFDTKMILSELEKEENKFRRTLTSGLKVLQSKAQLSGKDLFDLFQSFGLPLEVSLEEARERGLEINAEAIKQYDNLLEEHKQLSRTASAGMFKGGLADAGEETTRLHTAAHLMLAALRLVLGDGVYQKGSNITPERLRFDFSYPEKMTTEQIKQVEELVNEQIGKDLIVELSEMSIDEARATGAMGVFDSKYGEKVKVYSIGDFSREMCGGPHVARTGNLGKFKITKEEASSAGVRRLKATLD